MRYIATFAESDWKLVLERELLLGSPGQLFHCSRVQVDKFLSADWETRPIRGTNDKPWLKNYVRHDWF